MTSIDAQAIQNLIRSTQYGIEQAKNDLATMTVKSREQHYHQGYQNGRIAEMEKLVGYLEVVLQMDQAS